FTADGEKQVDIACSKLAIGWFIACNVVCLQVFERQIVAFSISELGHSRKERFVKRRISGLNPDVADAKCFRLLCVDDAWPSGRTAQQCDELPSPHSITSSAVARRF